jgi:hypothetical protein
MKHLTLILLLIITVSTSAFAQRSKKGFEFTGTKTRVSHIGKSKMFSEGVKPLNFTIYWNKKKNLIQVNAGEKENWYTIALSQVDTIHGNVTHIGYLEGTTKNPDTATPDKNRCEVRFLIDKVSIKRGEARIEEYLLDGATIWDDRSISSN